jgi:hypothetical protein
MRKSGAREQHPPRYRGAPRSFAFEPFGGLPWPARLGGSGGFPPFAMARRKLGEMVSLVLALKLTI